MNFDFGHIVVMLVSISLAGLDAWLAYNHLKDWRKMSLIALDEMVDAGFMISAAIACFFDNIWILVVAAIVISSIGAYVGKQLYKKGIYI